MLTLGELKCHLKNLEIKYVDTPRGTHMNLYGQIRHTKARIAAMEAVIFNPAERRHSHYGIHIKILEMDKLRCLTEKVKADHKADVHIEIDGQVREFTFDEFFGSLGFKEE